MVLIHYYNSIFQQNFNFLHLHNISDFIIVVHVFVIFVHDDPAADPCNQGVDSKSVIDPNTLPVHCDNFILVVALMESYEYS